MERMLPRVRDKCSAPNRVAVFILLPPRLRKNFGRGKQEECEGRRMERGAVKSCLLDSLAIMTPQQLWSPEQDLQNPRVDLWPRPSLRISHWIFARGDSFCLENVREVP